MDNASSPVSEGLFAKWHEDIDYEIKQQRHADSGHEGAGDESVEDDASAGPAPEPEPEPDPEPRCSLAAKQAAQNRSERLLRLRKVPMVEGVRGWLLGGQQSGHRSYNWEDHQEEYLEFLAELLNSEDSEEKTEAQVAVEMLGMADREVVWARAEQMQVARPGAERRAASGAGGCRCCWGGGGVNKPKRTRRKKTKRTRRKKPKKSKRSKIKRRTKPKRRTKR